MPLRCAASSTTARCHVWFCSERSTRRFSLEHTSERGIIIPRLSFIESLACGAVLPVFLGPLYGGPVEAIFNSWPPSNADR